MSKPIIAVDIDDVLSEGTDSLRIEVNKRLGVDLKREHYKVSGPYWGYYESVWERHGIAHRISMAELDPQMQIDQSHIAAMDGAHQALEKLKQRYTLVVVTAREPEWETATTVWLEANFPGTFREMVIVGREGVKNRNKGQLCKDIGAEWLIDDNPEHARNAIEEGIKVVLFGTYGWHQDVPSDMPHCKTWTEVEEFFYGQN